MEKPAPARRNVPNRFGYSNWGYWIGGIFCCIGLLSLSLGFVPLLKSVRKKPVSVRLPGEQVLDLRLPGAYVAVAAAQTLSLEDQRLVNGLEYSLRPKKNPKDSIRVIKIPARQFVSDELGTQMPLLQFAVDEEGTYLFNSEYPYGIDGPRLDAILYHADAPRYIKSEIIAGTVLFLLMTGLGVYFILKTRRLQNPSAGLP